MTSSIFEPRSALGPWAPSTQATASTTFDLPLPLGPTTTVTPGSRCSVTGSAKDLKPFRVSDFRNTSPPYRPPSTNWWSGRVTCCFCVFCQAFFVSQKIVSISFIESRSRSATAGSLVFFASPAVFVAFQNRSWS